MEALKAHYLAEVRPRAVTSPNPLTFLLRYPWQLIDSYQPVIIPAVFGAFILCRNRDARGDTGLILPSSAFVPVLALNVLSGRTLRYIFPIFPALPLCAGFWLAHVMRAIARAARRFAAPALLIAGAILLWVTSDVLIPLLQSAEDKNREIKQSANRLRDVMPPDERVAFFGGQYWLKASPLLYYAKRLLGFADPTPAATIQRAAARLSRLLLWDRDKLGQIDRAATPYRIVFETRDWVLLRLM